MVRILLFALMLIIPASGFSQKRKIKKANEDTMEWRYDIEGMGTGTVGKFLVKVWCFSKKPNVAALQAYKNAVHGVIFKGVPAKGRTPGKKPLVESISVEKKYADFFKKFFADGGEYMQYAMSASHGIIGEGDVMKIGKEYKVGVLVEVNYASLKKALEEVGIVKKLGAGF